MTSRIQPPGRQLDQIWDNRLEKNLVRLMPGDYFISAEQEVASTVLGSCVSACIRDVKLGIGGMNHFLLPALASGDPDGANMEARYGTYAMNYLINGILEMGGRLENLEVKVFGGGRIVDGLIDVGQQNIKFVRSYLAQAGLTPAAEDLGLRFPRKVNYFTDSGRVMVRKLRAIHSRSVAAEERGYSQQAMQNESGNNLEVASQ